MQRHGNGTLTEINGIVYEGDCMHDCKEEKGKLTYPNGDVYKGSIIQNKVIVYLILSGRYNSVMHHSSRAHKGDG